MVLFLLLSEAGATLRGGLGVGAALASEDAREEDGAFVEGFVELGFVELGFVELGFVEAGLLEAGLVEAGFVEAGLAMAGVFRPLLRRLGLGLGLLLTEIPLATF